MSTAPDANIVYYETQADRFFAETVHVDMAPLRARFLAYVGSRANILDAGCGSGRDARAFRAAGYAVTALEPSQRLAALAEIHCGLRVERVRFQEIAWSERFDGIWACASLLHLPEAELPGVMQRLRSALKLRGILYASFKYGSGEREHHGRRFTDLDEPGLAALLGEVPGLGEVETWITGDLRPGREAERWLNTLLRRMD
jgi:SAM-dependent methyltransferase